MTMKEDYVYIFPKGKGSRWTYAREVAGGTFTVSAEPYEVMVPTAHLSPAHSYFEWTGVGHQSSMGLYEHVLRGKNLCNKPRGYQAQGAGTLRVTFVINPTDRKMGPDGSYELNILQESPNYSKKETDTNIVPGTECTIAATIRTGKSARGGSPGAFSASQMQALPWAMSNFSYISGSHIQNPTKDNPATYAEYWEIYPVGTALPKNHLHFPKPSKVPHFPIPAPTNPAPDSTP